MVALYIHNSLRAMWTIGLVSRNSGGPGFTRGHPKDSLFESRNKLSCTNSKLERFTLLRGIKGRTVGEPAGVVHLNHVARLCLGHDDLLCQVRAQAYTRRWEDGKSCRSHQGPSRARCENVV